MFLLLFVASAATARAAQIESRDLKLVVNDAGCGFVDSVAFKGREVIRAPRAFAGGTIVLAAAGDGTASSLFHNRVVATLKAAITSLTKAGDNLTVKGAYSDGKVSIPFTRTLAPVSGKSAITVREEVDFSALGQGHLVAAHTLALPLVTCKDEHHRLLAFGGASRAEMFRMDLNDERRRNQNLSDNRAYWPYWDLGGVVQTGDSYRLWRANHADTRAYPIEQGTGAPGWADYSELDWGLTVRVLDPAKAAPWAIQINARTGTLSVSPHPPDQMPAAGKDLGTRELRFVLTFHEASWPAACPCELPFETYKRFLDYLNQGSRYTHLDYVCGGVGIQVKGGAKSREQMEDVYRRVIVKERIQPSVLLRLLYRGDAWRMQGIVRDVLGKRVPRNQPMAAWEAVAKEFFEKARRSGFPEKRR